MATGRCDACGVEEYMPFVCKFCKGRYCASHRLPENHQCNGLGEYKERIRQEGRIMMPEGGVVQPELSMGARLRSGLDNLIGRMEGRATVVLLAAMAGVFFFQLIMGFAPTVLFWTVWLDRFFFMKPWTLVTSVFAHADFNHFFFNGLFLFFLGPFIERVLGTRRYVYLFIGGGVIAGLAQVLIFQYALAGTAVGAPYQIVIGASGGLMALLGALAVLAPKMKILLMFVIPVPLWALTAVYAALDLMGAFNPGSSIAHVAHLAGLGIGLWYGKKLQNQGLRVQVGQPQGMQYGRRF